VNYQNDLHDDEPQEREISLGTATIIGIFLALTLICAAFFGFGYSMGRHSAITVAPVAADTKAADPRPDSTFSNFKNAPEPAADSDTPAPARSSKPAQAQPVSLKQPADDEAAPDKPAVHTPAAPLPSATPAGQFVVQVSATTRESDAQSLLAALKRKGYTANVKQEADNRFHVQVGPFASKADAETTRKQLDADGYKGPFIK
jgi:DedD protein